MRLFIESFWIINELSGFGLLVRSRAESFIKRFHRNAQNPIAVISKKKYILVLTDFQHHNNP